MGQYGLGDIDPTGSFRPSDVDASAFPQVPISAMTGLPSSARRALSALNYTARPFSTADQPSIGESGSLPISGKAALLLQAASLLPGGKLLKVVWSLDEAAGPRSWISPTGEAFPVGGYLEHDSPATLRGLPGNPASFEDAISKGYVHQAGDGVTVNTLDNPQLPSALYRASGSDGKTVSLEHDMNGKRWATDVPRQDFGDFLSNPKKYAAANGWEMQPLAPPTQ